MFNLEQCQALQAGAVLQINMTVITLHTLYT